MGKNDKDDSIEGTLRRIIPNNILPNGLKTDRYKQLNSLDQEDSLTTTDLYKMFEEDERVLSPEPNFIKQENELYFGTQKETDDILKFWEHDFERCDIMFMLEKYVASLADKWDMKWPQKLKLIYIEAYEMYREHFDHPQIFASDVEFWELKQDAQVTLLYGELLYDAVLNNVALKNKSFPCNSMATLELICSRKSEWAKDYITMCLRLHWLKANILMNENNNDLAIRSLNNIIYFIKTTENPKNYLLSLPNCISNPFITLKNTEKLLKSIEMLHNLDTLETLYNNQNYNEVIKILKQTFDNKFSVNARKKIDRPIQIFMFLHSLWFLDKYECVSWAEVCFNEALSQYLRTCSQPDSSEHKRWTAIVTKCLVMIEACIKEETIIVVDRIKETQIRFVENLTTVICHQFNHKPLDNDMKIPLETIKPWILLHYILQREEHRVNAKRHRHVKSSDSDDEVPKTPKSDESEEEEDKDIPPSIQILFSAHEFLGKKGWCLENSGEILLFMVDVVLYRLNAPIFEGIKEKIEIHLEQAFFCLFQHPSKKNKVFVFIL